MDWASLAAKPITTEQRQANLEDEARRKAEAGSLALYMRAAKLAEKIENVIKNVEGGQSAKYLYDLQYTVSGKWTKLEAKLAFKIWVNNLNAEKRGSDVALNMHMLGPTFKTTGGRNHYQFNFFRYRTSARTDR